MKKKSIILWIAAAVLLAAVLLTANANRRIEYEEVRGSTWRTEGDGIAALYRAVRMAGQKVGFGTERHAKRARYLPEGCLAVVPAGSPSVLRGGTEAEDLCGFVSDGGSLLLLWEADNSPESIFPCLAGTEGQTELVGESVFRTFAYGEGFFLFCENDSYYYGILNEGVRARQDPGEDFLLFVCSFCTAHGIRSVVFDEYYLGIAESELWDGLGGWLILGTAELLLAGLVYLFAGSRRFGAPVTVPEFERRSETEDVEALAQLYRALGVATDDGGKPEDPSFPG